MNAIKAPFMVSALDHRDSISGDDITLEPHPQMTKLMLRGEEQLLAAWIKKTLQITAPKPCKSTYKKDEALHWLGPDTWLYIASDGEISKTALSSFAQAGVRGQVTDVSHHYTHFEVSGPRARDALQKLSTLDLHRSVLRAAMWRAHSLRAPLLFSPPARMIVLISSCAVLMRITSGASWPMPVMNTACRNKRHWPAKYCELDAWPHSYGAFEPRQTHQCEAEVSPPR